MEWIEHSVRQINSKSIRSDQIDYSLHYAEVEMERWYHFSVFLFILQIFMTKFSVSFKPFPSVANLNRKNTHCLVVFGSFRKVRFCLTPGDEKGQDSVFLQTTTVFMSKK